MFAPSPMDFAYHFTLALFKEQHSFLSSMTVTEYYLYALLLFFSSPLIGGFLDHAWNFEGVTTLADSNILPS